jgi:hypothetical protein
VRDAHTDKDINMPLVVFNTMNGDEIEAYSSWESVTTSTETFSLCSDEKLKSVSGEFSVSTTNTAITTITTGDDANINGGVAYISATVRAYVDVQRRFDMALIRRQRGAVFISDKQEFSRRYRSMPSLQLNIQPAAPNGILIVYLLDVDALNVGHLFTFTPWTFKNAQPNVPTTVSIDVTMTAYDLPAHHRLGVVVATRDMLFLDQSPDSSNIVFLDGSTLTMPING